MHSSGGTIYSHIYKVPTMGTYNLILLSKLNLWLLRQGYITNNSVVIDTILVFIIKLLQGRYSLT